MSEKPWAMDKIIIDLLEGHQYSWKELQKLLITATLNRNNHNRVHSARALGISVRTMRNKIKKYNLAKGKHGRP